MAMSKAVQAILLAQAVAVSGPYQALAQSLAAHAIADKAASEGVKGQKASTWSLFKSAIKVAADNGHDSAAMRAGLEIACTNAEIPKGSFMGYVSTVENLAADLADGTLTLAEVNSISVADARKRYKAPPTELEAAHAKLQAIVKDWTAEQILLLCDLASDDGEAEQEATDVHEDEAIAA